MVLYGGERVRRGRCKGWALAGQTTAAGRPEKAEEACSVLAATGSTDAAQNEVVITAALLLRWKLLSAPERKKGPGAHARVIWGLEGNLRAHETEGDRGDNLWRRHRDGGLQQGWLAERCPGSWQQR